jgi:hypothetical protein
VRRAETARSAIIAATSAETVGCVITTLRARFEAARSVAQRDRDAFAKFATIPLVGAIWLRRRGEKRNRMPTVQ